MSEDQVYKELGLIELPQSLLDFMEIVSIDIKRMKEQLISQQEEIENLKAELQNLDKNDI